MAENLTKKLQQAEDLSRKEKLKTLSKYMENRDKILMKQSRILENQDKIHYDQNLMKNFYTVVEENCKEQQVNDIVKKNVMMKLSGV